MSRFTAYILTGIPGSGKSTFCREVLKLPHKDQYCSADDFHLVNNVYVFRPENARTAHQWCLRRFIDACKCGYDPVVCDNTNTTVAAIAPYVAVAQAYGYDAKIVYFETSVAESIRRNVHAVPHETIRRMAAEHKRLMHDDNIPAWWEVVDGKDFEP